MLSFSACSLVVWTHPHQSPETEQERLAALVEERQHVIAEDDRGSTPGKASAGGRRAAGQGAGGGDMVEREAKRLEVMKRRQQREMGQMVAFEVAREKMQVRISDSW